MKQFSLEEYLKNPSRKAVTRDGRNARIICTDAKSEFPIIALIDNGTAEQVKTFRKNGHFDCDNIDNSLDLFLAPEKHEGWVNVYRIGGLGCRCIYDSEEKARQNADKTAIATVKIEWEE